MAPFFRRRGNEFRDLEQLLHEARPAPRPGLVRSLGLGVRELSKPKEPTPLRWRRFGLAAALTGALVVALTSFGGVGYASSAMGDAAKKVQRATRSSAPAVELRSAAASQYGAPETPTDTDAAGVEETEIVPTEPTTPAGPADLPYTGATLLGPFLLGFTLIMLGMVLRRRGRRAPGP